MRIRIERGENSSNQQQLPEQFDRLPRKESRLRRMAKSRLGVLGAAGAVAFAAGKGYIPGVPSIPELRPHQAVQEDESKIDIDMIKFEAIDLKCTAKVTSEIDKPTQEEIENGASPSGLRSKLTTAGKGFPGTGYEATISGKAITYGCYDGAYMETATKPETGRQTVKVDRAGMTFITEWKEKEVVTSLPTVSSMGGIIAATGKVISAIPGLRDARAFDDYVNENRARFGQYTEDYATAQIEGRCMEAAKTPMEATAEAGIYLSARNQGIDPSTIDVAFVGNWPSSDEFEDSEADKIGFEITDNTIETNCTIAPDATVVDSDDISDYMTPDEQQLARKLG